MQAQNCQIELDDYHRPIGKEAARLGLNTPDEVIDHYSALRPSDRGGRHKWMIRLESGRKEGFFISYDGGNGMPGANVGWQVYAAGAALRAVLPTVGVAVCQQYNTIARHLPTLRDAYDVAMSAVDAINSNQM